MTGAFDLAILGSGFGGSLLAMVARRLGRSVLLLERGAHPRFAIGESTSPLTNLLLEELAREYDLPRLLPFAGYGTWKRAYPDVPVGLKRGFTYYHHRAGEPFGARPERQDQLMVAASPADDVADTHWFRQAFDAFLVREAQALGAGYVDRISLESVSQTAETWSLAGARGGRSVRYSARFVVDATGPRGALSRLLDLPEAAFHDFPRTQALFSHFTGVSRFEEQLPAAGETPPYRPDDAALHHVFDGGWMWVLRFENGITSAGFALEDAAARELRLEDREGAWQRLLARFPSIAEQFREAEAVQPFFHLPRLSYRCGRLQGPGWALLPSAAAFVDPFFSTGFPLTLLGIHRLGAAIREAWAAPGWETRMAEYERLTRREAETSARLVSASYAAFADFPAFAALSMLYFAAAGYTEMARRLGRLEPAPEFLLGGRPAFREPFERHTSAARAGRPSPFPQIAADMEPFNVAGLCDPAKRGWYGVDLEDVVRGATKLGAAAEEVRDLVRRMRLDSGG